MSGESITNTVNVTVPPGDTPPDNEPDTADRKQFEQRGLTFTSLVISAETLSAATVDGFASRMRAVRWPTLAAPPCARSR